jgi:hypothetical protein
MNTQPHKRKEPVSDTASGQKHAITQGGEAAGLEWRADPWTTAHEAAQRALAGLSAEHLAACRRAARIEPVPFRRDGAQHE